MSKSEFTANVQGFSCYEVSRKASVKAQGSFNYVKAFGYVVTLLVILAVVVK